MFFHKKPCEIFWQAVSDNPHFRRFFVAKSETKLFSTTRKFARIPLVGWQGIMAKPANNCDKAQYLSCVAGHSPRDGTWGSSVQQGSVPRLVCLARWHTPYGSAFPGVEQASQARRPRPLLGALLLKTQKPLQPLA